MARRRGGSEPEQAQGPVVDEVIDTPVVDEMSTSFMSYAMSVIISRALPDVRDGLKPVHRRILFSMHESNLRPDRSYVKCARVVGDCFVKGTLVSTPSGQVAIERIDVGDEVLDPNGKPVTVVAAYANAPSQVVEVKFSSGHTLVTTPGQRFRVVNDDYTTEWCEAKDLAGRLVVSLGDSVSPLHLGVDRVEMTASQRHAYTLGILVSEGSQVDRKREADGRVQFSMVDSEPAEEVLSWARQTGLGHSLRVKAPQVAHHQQQNVVRLSRQSDLLEATSEFSHNKRVPSSVLADSDQWLPFLAGFLDGDGYVRHDRNEIVLVTTSDMMARELRSILSGLGIQAGVWRRARVESHHHDLIGLTVSGYSATPLARLLLPFTRIGYKRAALSRVSKLDTTRKSERSDGLAGRALFTELNKFHLGAGWYCDTEGRKFRSSSDGAGSPIRHGRDRSGRELVERPFQLRRAFRDGWVDKLERIGSPLAKNLRDLEGHSFSLVEEVVSLDEHAPTFDIQVDSDEHAFVVEGVVVHNCMGKFHPHGDSAIYDALVRMAQDFSMRLPTIDGHGNFGTHADGAAAMRYTECRMAPAAVAMTSELGEDTVTFADNYDGKLQEPTVMPARYPNLLVNGSTGIAVGMATNVAPHNLLEAVEACKYYLTHPDATTDELTQFIPAPDFPTGGVMVGTDGAVEAYRTGKGQVVVRARTEFVDVTARKRGIAVTELPYQVGPEKVMARIKEVKDAKKLEAVTGVVDLSDRKHGLRLVIELRSGVDEKKVLRELFRLTPLQESFSIHNLALVGGIPKTLTLRELIGHYVDHRMQVTRLRTEYRKTRAEEKAHLLEGYLLALASIDEVVATIRASKDTAAARVKLCEKFVMTEIQATAVLEMPLRRLTSLEVNKIKSELAELKKVIKDLTHLLTNDKAMRELVAAELDETALELGTPRRTTILGAADVLKEAEAAAAAIAGGDDAAVDIEDEPTTAWLSTQGMLGRAPALTGKAGKMDVMLSWLGTSTRGKVGVVTDRGRMHIVPVYELVDAATSKSRGVPVAEVVELVDGEKAIALVNPGSMIALATEQGLIKRVSGADMPKKTGMDVIILKDDDRLVGAYSLPEGQEEAGDLLLVSSGAQLLRTPLSGVNPKGAKAGGMGGMKLSDGDKVIAAAVVLDGSAADLVTVTDKSAVKVTPISEYPVKGRGGQGVRCHKLLSGESALTAALISEASQATGLSATGALVALPAVKGKRDGSGTPVDTLAALAGLPPKPAK